MSKNKTAAAGAPRRLKADAVEGAAKQHLLSLVSTTFFGRVERFVDKETGEILQAPVKVGLIKYPDGGAELFALPRSKRSKQDNSGIKEQRLYEEDLKKFGPEVAAANVAIREEVRQQRSKSEAARRARCRVRRICRSYNLSVMVTLTFPGDGIHDYDLALRYVQDFIHDHGMIIHLGGMWLAVPKLHPNGHGCHWHILVSRRFKKSELVKLWNEWTLYLGRKGVVPSGGAKFVRIDVEEFENAGHASAYAAKYVGKSFDRDSEMKYRKRYLSKKKADVAVQEGGAWCLDEVREFISAHIDGYVYDSAQDEEWQGPPMVWTSW